MPARRATAAFTMLELMMVLAVVAILASLALPSIQARVIRAQVVEARSVADFVRQAVAQHYVADTVMPHDNEAAGVPPADRIVGRFVSGVTVIDGAVTLTFGNQVQAPLRGRRLTLRPAYVPQYSQVPVAWVCAAAAVPAKMAAAGRDLTDLPAAYLPLDCRGGAASAPR